MPGGQETYAVPFSALEGGTVVQAGGWDLFLYRPGGAELHRGTVAPDRGAEPQRQRITGCRGEPVLDAQPAATLVDRYDHIGRPSCEVAIGHCRNRMGAAHHHEYIRFTK